MSGHAGVIVREVFRSDGAVGGPYVGEKHEGGYSGGLYDRTEERVDVGIWECSHGEILEIGICALIEVVSVDLNGMDTVVFADLGCGGAGPMSGGHAGIRWDWECSIGGGYITVVGVLDDKTEVSEGSVSFSGGNGCGLFVNSVLEFGERAVGQFFGGRCYFGHIYG